MAELDHFAHVLKVAPRSDVAVLLTCLLLTVVVDMVMAVSVGVVMASRGYPDAYEKGKRIIGLERVTGDDVKIFHAGTRLTDGEVLSDGGRVLCAVALGGTVAAARDKAYDAVGKVSWDGAFWRKDIGYRAVEREKRR